MNIHRTTLVLFVVVLPMLIGTFVLSFFAYSHSLHAAPDGIIIVDTLQDETDGSCVDGDCSLRDAINTANNNDIINFDVVGTITLSSSLGYLNINQDLTINGGNVITVSGDDKIRIFNVTAGQVAFDSLAITKGHAQLSDGCSGFAFADACGAGIMIRNSGTIVTVTNSVFSDNRITVAQGNGAGIFNLNGSLTVSNSTFTKNDVQKDGPSIFNGSGTLRVDNSRFFENKGGHGGGIYAWYAAGETIVNNSIFHDNVTICGGGLYVYYGKMTVNNSTIADNEAVCGGALRNFDGIVTINNSTISGNSGVDGGAFYINDGTTTINNSTISDNISSGISATSGGGALNLTGDNPTVTIRNSTITSNTAPNLAGKDGIWYEVGNLIFENTIIANNGSSNCTIDGASFDGSFHNMSDDDSCTGFAEVADVMLGDLADNGGETLTHALLFGSPAIDAGDCSGSPSSDQRGVTRPQDDTCDIGSFEGSIATVYLPSILNQTFTGMAPIFIGNEIAQREVENPGKVFYSATISVPQVLPTGGDFYLSSQPNALTEVLVDDEIILKVDDSVVFTHDFSAGGGVSGIILTISRNTVELMAGKIITVEYVDVYGTYIQASEMWVIWIDE